MGLEDLGTAEYTGSQNHVRREEHGCSASFLHSSVLCISSTSSLMSFIINGKTNVSISMSSVSLSSKVTESAKRVVGTLIRSHQAKPQKKQPTTWGLQMASKLGKGRLNAISRYLESELNWTRGQVGGLWCRIDCIFAWCVCGGEKPYAWYQTSSVLGACGRRNNLLAFSYSVLFFLGYQKLVK